MPIEILLWLCMDEKLYYSYLPIWFGNIGIPSWYPLLTLLSGRHIYPTIENKCWEKRTRQYCNKCDPTTCMQWCPSHIRIQQLAAKDISILTVKPIHPHRCAGIFQRNAWLIYYDDTKIHDSSLLRKWRAYIITTPIMCKRYEAYSLCQCIWIIRCTSCIPWNIL